MKGTILISFFLCGYIYPQLWVRTYNGPAQGMDNSYAIAIDPSGNILTTGYVSMPHYGEPIPNYCTIKYTTDGELQWVRFFDYGFGLAIATDSSANVYVTGENVTIKYTPRGDVVWVRTYGDNFWGSAIATNRQGNAYVTGYIGDYPDRFAITIKYNPEGEEEWVRIDSIGVWCVSVALDTNGNVYVAGFGRKGGVSYLIMKYSPDGELLWRRGENIYGTIYKMQLSPAGVYVTGSLLDNAGYPITIVTVKYNSQGEEQWVRFFDGPGYDIGQTLTIDPEGNCYIAGGTAERPGIQSSYDIIVIKYAPDGTELWQRRYNGCGSDDYPFAVGVDSRKNLYVGGYSKAPRDTSYWGDDYTLIKYDSFGSLQWEARYCGPDSIAGWVYALAIDNEGYIYTTGFIITGTRQNYDYDWCTIKYPPTGPGISEVPNSPLPRYQRIKVYPNPARSEGLITLPSGLIGLRLSDVGGRLVKTFTAQKDKIVLAGVKPGVYLLRWQQDKDWVSTKLVVR
ncbi:MAG: T9SS type A sorting domain-containing protein [candidate division WOR-3 bacterium]